MNSVTMREYLRRHVLGLLAIFIALSGTAIAAGDGPTASSSAVTTAKFKKLKVRVGALESKLNSPAKGDLTGTYPNLQIAANAVTTGKIADSAVTAGKLEVAQRAETFEAHTSGLTAALATPIGATHTIVQTLDLPAGGKYLVNAQAEAFNGAATTYHVHCQLGNVRAGSSEGDTATGGPDLLFGSSGITLTGISTGGTVTLGCSSDTANIFAGARNIEAVRVG
jgi:hypothetical protein